MPEFLSPENDERQEVAEVAPSALAILNQSEHAAMVQTANLSSNKRKLAEFDSKLMQYATHSQPVALSMFYSLPRAGKQVIGPSVRFAEVVAPCWRNCAVAARSMGDGQSMVTAQGIFLDYEANLRNCIEVPRRITDKNGNRYSDDMIVTTLNAAMSVARRNAVLKGGVPQALWTPPYEAAQQTAVGKAASHAQRVADAMEYLHKLGVTEWQILNAVGVPSVRELETEHLVTLRVLCQEIKRGDKTIEEVFGSQHDKEIDALFAQLKMNQAQQTMLRNSYLGRAQELVIYLRERLGSGTVGEPMKPKGCDWRSVEETVAQKSTPAYNEKQAQERGVETKVYSDGTTATGVGPLPNQSPAQQDQSDKKPDDAPWGRQDSQAQEQPKLKAVEFGFGANDPLLKTEVSAQRETLDVIGREIQNTRHPQTTMEPPAKRRGRPSREEMARRAAAMGVPLNNEEESETSAREQAEKMVDSDTFVF